MVEQVKPVEPGPAQSNGADASELREELTAARQEILRLRDLLIGKDAELGAARGRLAELEDHSQRVANVAERLQSRVPGLMRIGGAALRKLQRRG